MSAEVVGRVDLSDKRGMERWRGSGGKKARRPQALPPFPPLAEMVGRARPQEASTDCPLTAPPKTR